MAEAIKRYKLILIIMCLMLLIAFLVFAIFMQKPDRIPSKGIFVFADTNEAYSVKVSSAQKA